MTYTGLAPLYDRLVPRVSSTARTVGRDWLGVQDGERVLEVGTGTGLAFAPLVSANPNGWTEGVDVTPAMLRRARRRMADCAHDRYRLRHGRATALPFSDDAFDAVFSSYLIDVLPHTGVRAALGEMHRVLRPHGRLVLVHLAPPRRGVEHVWGRLAHHLPPLLGGARPIDLAAPLRDCGFTLHAQTARSQLGLRSNITSATPA